MKLEILAVAAAIFALVLGTGTSVTMVCETTPLDGEALIIQATKAIANESYKEAVEIAEKILAAYPDTPLAVMILGAGYFGLDEYEKARMTLEHAVALNPENYLNYKMLGDIWQRQDLTIACGYWDKALELNPGILEFYSHAAWRLMYAGDLDGGMAYIRRGLALFPDDRGMLLASAFALGRAGRYEQVDEIYRQLLTLNRTDSEVVARGVMLSVITGDMETAAKGLAYLQSLGGDEKFYLLASGFYHIATGEYEESLAAYTALLDADLLVCDRYQVWHNVGTLHAFARRWREALGFISQSYDLLVENPGLDNSASRWKQNTMIGLFNQELGNEQEAVRRYAASVESGYGDDSAYLRYASLLYQEGNGEKALEILAAGRERFPDHLKLLSLTVHILVDAGRQNEAREFLQKIVDRGPTEPSDADDVEWAEQLLSGSNE